MAADYSPAGHELLSEAAQAAEVAGTLDAYAEAVERELGLRGTRLTGEDASTATLAVVYGVNCLIERRETGKTLISESKGNQSRTFAEEAKDPSSWCYKARKLAEEVIGWNRVTGFR